MPEPRTFTVAVTYIKFVTVTATTKSEALQRADREGLISSTDKDLHLCNWHIAEPN